MNQVAQVSLQRSPVDECTKTVKQLSRKRSSTISQETTNDQYGLLKIWM